MLIKCWLFKRAKIYHLKVHISHKKLKQGAKVTPPTRCLGQPMVVGSLSRNTLLGVLLYETISFQDSDCSLFEKKQQQVLLFYWRQRNAFCCVFLLVIIAVLIAWTCFFSFKQGFFLLRLPPSFFAFRSLSLLSLSETAHSLHLFFSKRSVWVNLFTVLI